MESMQTAEASQLVDSKDEKLGSRSVNSQKVRGRKVEVVGEVISDKMDKTITVMTYRMVRHNKYGKYVKRTSIFKAHDEKNEAKQGDIVSIQETRPLSKTKRWKLIKVVEVAKA